MRPAAARSAAIPAAPLALGWSGVIPFAALLAGAHALPAEWAGLAASGLMVYGAVILAFMGGVQWGLELARSVIAPEDAHADPISGYAISVLPALLGFAATFLPLTFAYLTLAAGFAGLLAYDLARVKAGVGPAWYASLRMQLSAAVISLLALAALTLR